MQGDRPDDPLIPPPAATEDEPRGSLADGVKRALLAGVGALFMTEEGARRMARDWKLPKEVASFIGQQARSAKDEVLRLFADEIRRFLESESVRREFLKTLSEHAIEIRAEIRLRPDAEGTPRAQVKTEARPIRGRRKKGGR